MDPYTPRTHPVGRKKNLALSTKEYTKVAGTIASARRSRNLEYGDDERNGRSRHDFLSKDPSFIAETSFVKAPLNSRVPSHSHTTPKAHGKGKSREESLDNASLDIQEALILEDLLFVLMGIEGAHITFHPDYSVEDDDPVRGIKFAVSSALDPSLSDLVERILPLATYYTGITSFIEMRSHLEYGLVNHALCASIRDMLKDYQTLLSQLEHAFNTSPQFSLQKLWFYVHPTLHTLSLIYQLTTELASADNLENSSGLSSDSDSDDARNEALGLGGAKLKAVLSDLKNPGLDAESNIPVKGGEVLSVIYDRMQNMSGDPAALTLYDGLLRAAGAPYALVLQEWINSGKLHDPWEELCVKESKSITKGTLDMDYVDEYWDRRYTLRDGSSAGDAKRKAGMPTPRGGSSRLPGGACIPPVLEAWKHKILLAGKYLNVIRECGIGVTASRDVTTLDTEISMEDEKFYKSIEDAYSYANRTLLNMLLQDQQLLPRLRSLKRFFFMSQSFFVTHLLDQAQSELRKSSKTASVLKLQSLLDLALNTDLHGEDTMFREDVKVKMANNGLYDWLLKIISEKGAIGGEFGEAGITDSAHGAEGRRTKDEKPLMAIDALMLDYQVKFPLSLVISRKTILQYQLLFRFLLHLKHAEQTLSSMWIDQKTTPWRLSVSHHPEFEKWKLRVFLLRARMLAFVQQILAFVTFEVLEPNWRNLEVKLAKVTTVDQLLRDHSDFLDTCLKESMLTSARLLSAYSRMITTCSTFAVYSTKFTASAVKGVAAADDPNGDPEMEKRWDFLYKFEKNFNHWFGKHLDCVQYYASSDNGSLLPLVMRLSSVKAG